MKTQPLVSHMVHALIPEKSKRFQYIMSLKLQLHSQYDSHAITDTSITCKNQ